jgi:hypothetical protein
METLIDDLLTMQADVRQWTCQRIERLVAKSMSQLSDKQHCFARRILSQAEATGELPHYRRCYMEEALENWPWELLSSKMLTIHHVERLAGSECWPEPSPDESSLCSARAGAIS